MRFIQTLVGLVGLVATASAVDVYLHVGGDCSGNAIVCVGINPNNCCGGSGADIFPSVGFRGIPFDWTLQTRGHNGGNCNGLREVQRAAGTNFMCLRNGWFSGGGYGFTNKKRENAVDDACAAAESCTGSQKPDLLLLEDGGKYNIADMDAESFTTMVST